jgi:arylsulfatase A-like enzyme
MNQTGKKPNIIFFFTDQQRWDTCGCYGQELPITPHLDKMAAQGVRFNHAYTCQPVCGPARASLQTGKYPTEVGCFRNDIMLPGDEKTVAAHFNEYGYDTAYIGKWHLASESRIGINNRTKPIPKELRGGYKDEWIAADALEFTSHPQEGRMFDINGNPVEFKDRFRADWQTDLVCDYLEKKTTENPFFLFISYIEPHHQNDMNVSIGPEGSREKWKDFKAPADLEGADVEGSWREEYPDYLGCCHALDQGLGRVRAKLEELNLTDDTVVIYTTDHGSHFRTRNKEYKRSCHDGCTRLPMVISGPGFEGGKVIDDLVSLIDIPPTFLETAGIPVPSYMRGRALNPLAAGKAVDWRQEVYFEISESHIGRAIRSKKWKYEVSIPDHMGKNGGNCPGGDVYYETYLYDLESDPLELNNLVRHREYGETREALSVIIKGYIDEIEARDVTILPSLISPGQYE